MRLGRQPDEGLTLRVTFVSSGAAAMPFSDDQLIARYIKEDPYLKDEAEVRLADSLVHVWAIIGQLKVDDWDVAQVARDYDIPEIEVEAAVAYYGRHKEALDARLANHVILPASAFVSTGV
jgi:uncharacterized protein (DUF433 family)